MKPSQIELFMHHLLKENYDFVSLEVDFLMDHQKTIPWLELS